MPRSVRKGESGDPLPLLLLLHLPFPLPKMLEGMHAKSLVLKKNNHIVKIWVQIKFSWGMKRNRERESNPH